MLSVEQAISAILDRVRPFPPIDVPLDESLGLVLAEDAVSDVDSPPFDKSLMDGYAVRAADVSQPGAALDVIEEVTAGQVPRRQVADKQAARIMTGAPLPEGADAVIPVEHTEFNSRSGEVSILAGPVSTGANIIRRGTSLRAGDTVLPAGRELRPQEIAALAESGFALASARPRPRIAVLATGDELVRVAETPGPGQIRNSNEPMLCAQVRRAGGEPVPLGIARDERADLSEKIALGLECDVLLLSGGVSAGKRDLVPSVLRASGVEEVFHKVNVKPGKPLWFGVRNSSCVFGLPGNPVSSMVCFELFVRTAIQRMMGVQPAGPQSVKARLSQDHLARGDRPTYHPARLDSRDCVPTVCPVPWHGSSDVRATVGANCMAVFPGGDAVFAAGTMLDVILW